MAPSDRPDAPPTREAPRLFAASRAAGGLGVAVVAWIAVATPACSLVLSTDGFEGAPNASESGTGIRAPGSDSDAGSFTPSGTGGAGAADAGNGAVCTPKRGEKGARGIPTDGPAGPYCIDAAEVTNAEYAAFLTATLDGVTAPRTGICLTKTTHVPKQGFPAPPALAQRPVVFVDYCDASAYCAWAGKRLCRGGGELDARDAARRGEWYLACERSAPGLSDMLGSVAEWEDACEGGLREVARPGGILCSVRGGAPAFTEDDPSFDSREGCAARAAVDFRHASATLGFRCCSGQP
jgi:hypothetical protein